MDELNFVNPGRRLQRGGLVGGAVCVAYAAVGAAILWFTQMPTRDGAGLFWAVSSIFAGCIALVMFLLAFIAVFVARAGDRAFAQFRSGQALADWSFPPDEWEAFLATELGRRSKGRFWLAAVVVAVPLGMFGVIFGLVFAHGVTAAVAWAGGTVAVVALALRLALAASAWADRRYLARMRRNRRVLIARGAIYCGGALTLWDVSMTVLQRIRVIPGSPLRLEVTVGPNRALQAMDMAAGVAAAASGGAGGGGGAGTTQVLVPVPAGREAEAAGIVNVLLPPARPARASAPPAEAFTAAGVTPDRAVTPPAPTARVPEAPTARVPEAPTTRVPARRLPWWTIAAGLWGVGLLLFLTAPHAPGGGGQDYTGLGTAMSVIGLFLWIGSLLAVIVAAVGTLRSVRHRRQAAGVR